MFILSDENHTIIFNANREQTYVDGRAFVKAKIEISIGRPVLPVKFTRIFEIEEILSDTKLGMFWDQNTFLN